MARKTIEVETIRNWVNARLQTKDSSLTVSELSPEQAFRMGAASLLAQILLATDNYAGFNLQGTEYVEPDGEKDDTYPAYRKGYDDSRRHYFQKQGWRHLRCTDT